MLELDRFFLKELSEIAKELNIDLESKTKKNDIIQLIKNHFEQQEGVTIGVGSLDVLPDGYGFLRNTSVEKDIYVSASQIKRFKLRCEDIVVGEVREPVGEEKNYGLKKVFLINGQSNAKAEARVAFDELKPSYPTEQLILETDKKNVAGRMIDIIAPIGKGQRGLIVAPPKAGKTILLSNLANSIIEKNKDVEVWLLLIDERPEEVTDIIENVKGALVYSSTFDEEPRNHIKVTEMVLEKAKRKIEDGHNIVILMDSITRLSRAYNIVIPSSGKLISGGIDPSALYYPKKFFGSARNIKNGGSLTIIATALIDTGSKMDEVIFEEFKGTGNLEIQLDRTLAELRIYPAIDIQKSGTRKEELLIPKEKLDKIWTIRRHLSQLDKVNATKKFIDLIEATESNAEMLKK